MGHEAFVKQALVFKRDLEASHGFSPDEVAAMLGSFVLAMYDQRIVGQPSPEMSEALQKATLVHERMLAEEGRW